MKKVSLALVTLLILVSSLVPALGLAEEPLTITMLNTYFASDAPDPEHPIFKMLEEATGTKFDITWIPAAGYAERMVLTLASKEMPMVINAKDETRKPLMIDAQRAGLFWELTDELLSEFPNLAQLNKDVNNNLKVDGKLYGLQQERAIGRENIIFRADWIEKLGLETPNTLEALEKCLYAFAQQDPDGDGVEDTYGLYLSEGYVRSLADWLCIAHGGANGWAISEDGSFTPTFETEEYKKGLEYLRKWYADGILNPDYVAVTSSQEVQDAFMAERSGLIMVAALDDALKLSSLFDVAPDAVIDVVPYSYDLEGRPFVRAGLGHSGAIMFTKSGIKDEETLRKVLAVFDVINDVDAEPFQTMVWGLEDVHYTRNEKGQIVQTAEQKQKRNDEINNFVQLRSFNDYRAYFNDNAVVSDLQASIWNAWNANASYAVSNPVNGFISDTYVDMGTDLDTIWQDAVNMYIMGEFDMAEYDAEIARWHAEGGDDVIAEYEECYIVANN